MKLNPGKFYVLLQYEHFVRSYITSGSNMKYLQCFHSQFFDHVFLTTSSFRKLCNYFTNFANSTKRHKQRLHLFFDQLFVGVITSRILHNDRRAERLSVNSPFQSVGHDIKIVFKGKVLCQIFFILEKSNFSQSFCLPQKK